MIILVPVKVLNSQKSMFQELTSNLYGEILKIFPLKLEKGRVLMVTGITQYCFGGSKEWN